MPNDPTRPRRKVGITPLKARRLARGQTIREVAEATGIPKDTLAAWEIGLQRPGPANKRRLAEYFGGELVIRKRRGSRRKGR